MMTSSGADVHKFQKLERTFTDTFVTDKIYKLRVRREIQ